MQKKLLLTIFMLLIFKSYSQQFNKGYFITNSKDTINCDIQHINWSKKPEFLYYKLSENDVVEKTAIASVKEIYINNISKHIKATVNIDKSSINLNHISLNKEPEFIKKTLFLNVLIDSDAALYEFINGKLKSYFYKINNSEIEQLINKKYKTEAGYIAENSAYKNQILNNLKCESFDDLKVQRLNYAKPDLVNFFIDYNNYIDKQVIDYAQNQERDVFNLNIRPGIKSASLSVTENGINKDFDSEIGFRIGLEFEYFLPVTKNNIALLLETNYQDFKSENDNGSVNYSSIEIPVGIRYYLDLNKKSKMFFNSSYIFDMVTVNSILDLSRFYKINSKNNFNFGIGYKLLNKYGMELNYQIPRNLTDYSGFDTKYKTISIILSYAIF